VPALVDHIGRQVTFALHQGLIVQRLVLGASGAPGVATIWPSWNLGAQVEALVSCVMVWLPSVSVTPRIGVEGSRGGAIERAVRHPTREQRAAGRMERAGG
jgi:hypothetical protein